MVADYANSVEYATTRTQLDAMINNYGNMYSLLAAASTEAVTLVDLENQTSDAIMNWYNTSGSAIFESAKADATKYYTNTVKPFLTPVY